jgi:hypothetical protein
MVTNVRFSSLDGLLDGRWPSVVLALAGLGLGEATALLTGVLDGVEALALDSLAVVA